jgi:hypothetical protein
VEIKMEDKKEINEGAYSESEVNSRRIIKSGDKVFDDFGDPYLKHKFDSLYGDEFGCMESSSDDMDCFA